VSSLSLAATINNAMARKKVPPFKAGDIHDLATKVGASEPISIRNLIGILNNLAPQSRLFVSGALTSGFVHSSAFLFVQSDGGFHWGGNVHESGAVGDHFRVALALADVKDSSGKVMVFNHEDTIVGQLEIGFSDKVWNDYGINQLIADNWEQVKGTGYEFVLHTATDVLQAIELGFSVVVIALAGVFIALSGPVPCQSDGDSKQQWKCGWQPNGGGPVQPGDPRNNPGAGADYICRCEY
jgi:hypothetical protein